MFTVAQIKRAHSKVKSGADFPEYIKDIKALGVTYYETYVADGHTDYYGADDYRISSAPKYDALGIADAPDIEQFKADLKAHQQGETDYPDIHWNMCQTRHQEMGRLHGKNDLHLL